MQITINIPDNLSQAFIHQEIQQLEEKLQQQSKITGQRVSKWKKMVQRIENKSFDLGDYSFIRQATIAPLQWLIATSAKYYFYLFA